MPVTIRISSPFSHSRRNALGVLAAFMPAVLLAPLSGCAWKPEIVHADPTLTSHDLVNGKIAIMPVKFDNDKAIPKERASCNWNLGRALKQNREDIPIVSTPQLEKARNGGLEEEAAMLKIYEQGGTEPNALASYRETIGARYLILSRLHYEQKAIHGGGQLTDAVESTLSGNVSIVDTTTAHVVWEAHFETTRSGMDTLVDPSPSRHALPFFSTIVNAWPAPT